MGFVFFFTKLAFPYFLEQKICPKCNLKKEEFMRTSEEYVHMVLDTDKNIWDMIELALRVICILVVLAGLMLICKTKYREAVRWVRYVHVLIAVVKLV